jgi:hypothetical protein
MGTRGPKPKPIERKEKIGRREHRAVSDKPAIITILPTSTINEIPKPHRQLLTINGEAGPGLVLWEKFWTCGRSWLREDDVELMMILCEQEDERAVLRRLVFQDAQDWRARAGLRVLEKLITDNLSLLGFTPTDRARIGFRSVANDPLDDFRKRVEAKRQKTK